jgi:hypothetical protein
VVVRPAGLDDLTPWGIDVLAEQLSGIAIQSGAALTQPDPDPAVLQRLGGS